ncbi:hypothetical protein [Nonomuraea sp. NPDC050786]|uniref:hypothetical protein n=1 Tax=Nonomuraea sp. NPDC050786 TaxID=3154840 RepID=UPI003407A956
MTTGGRAGCIALAVAKNGPETAERREQDLRQRLSSAEQAQRSRPDDADQRRDGW